MDIELRTVFLDNDDPATKQILAKSEKLHAKFIQEVLAAHPKKQRERLHLKTQSGQPYGSVRKCCERCGFMLAGQAGEEAWTSDEREWNRPPTGYTNCRDWGRR